MAISLSIRERILRQIKTVVESLTGIGTVRRWSDTASVTWNTNDAIVAVGEDKQQDSLTGPVRHVMRVAVNVVVFSDQDQAYDTEVYVSRWVTKIRQAFTQQLLLREATTNARLVVSLLVTDDEGPQFVDGSTEASVILQVTYDHDRDSENSLGIIITSVSVLDLDEG